ncbi:MAG: hypothetical protein FWF57_00290 [Defluviitaleaceae bacterium]|nr:hypothetical protein [Defluviitaleaceae bacterium]
MNLNTLKNIIKVEYKDYKNRKNLSNYKGMIPIPKGKELPNRFPLREYKGNWFTVDSSMRETRNLKLVYDKDFTHIQATLLWFNNFIDYNKNIGDNKQSIVIYIPKELTQSDITYMKNRLLENNYTILDIKPIIDGREDIVFDENFSRNMTKELYNKIYNSKRKSDTYISKKLLNGNAAIFVKSVEEFMWIDIARTCNYPNIQAKYYSKETIDQLKIISVCDIKFLDNDEFLKNYLIKIDKYKYTEKYKSKSKKDYRL